MFIASVQLSRCKKHSMQQFRLISIPFFARKLSFMLCKSGNRTHVFGLTCRCLNHQTIKVKSIQHISHAQHHIRISKRRERIESHSRPKTKTFSSSFLFLSRDENAFLFVFVFLSRDENAFLSSFSSTRIRIEWDENFFFVFISILEGRSQLQCIVYTV